MTFGGSRTLSGAARTLAYLPGARNTPLGEAAEQFTEGSVTRQVARSVPLVGRITGPLVGARLLSDRDPAKAEVNEQGQVVNRPMLVPAVGESLDTWTLACGARRRPRTAGDPEFVEGEDGELLPVSGVSRARRRMGTFTPAAGVSTPVEDHEANRNDERRQRERSDYAAEMQGEEMEQHLSDVMRAHTGAHSPLGGMLKEDGQGDAGRLGQVAARLEAAAEMLARSAQVQMMVGQLRVAGAPNVAGVMADVVGQVRSERKGSGQPQNAGIDHLQVADRMARLMGGRRRQARARRCSATWRASGCSSIRP